MIIGQMDSNQINGKKSHININMAKNALQTANNMNKTLVKIFI